MSQFAETNRLLAIWKDAERLFLRQPTKDNGALVQQAQADYLAEQTHALSKRPTTNPPAPTP